VTRRAVRAIASYLALLLVLAALGGWNQHLLARELAAMDQREALRREIVDLRAAAAAVQGPLAVAAWAQQRGMVPAPEIDRVDHVLPLPAPTVAPLPATGLEVRTVWR
jgi:hypothetical protein